MGHGEVHASDEPPGEPRRHRDLSFSDANGLPVVEHRRNYAIQPDTHR